MATKFLWQEKVLNTMDDIFREMSKIYASNDEELGTKFIAEYQKVNKHARKNIGYLTGYFPDMLKVQKFYRVAHPLFGYQQDITPEAAFEIGKNIATKWSKIPQ